MGRRKARRPELALDNQVDFTPPIMEKVVHKRVPAVVHWASVEGTDRTDDETIGEAIIYDDGTSDVMIFGELSEEAKKLVGVINARLDNYSIED